MSPILLNLTSGTGEIWKIRSISETPRTLVHIIPLGCARCKTGRCRTSRASMKLAASQSTTCTGKRKEYEEETTHTRGREEGGKQTVGRQRERKGNRGNPNEYLISAYLTPGKVQSDGMAGSLPGGWKEELRVPCTFRQPPRDIG